MADTSTLSGCVAEARSALEKAQDWVDGDGFSETEADALEENLVEALQYLGIALGEVKSMRVEDALDTDDDEYIEPDESLVLVADAPYGGEEEG